MKFTKKIICVLSSFVILSGMVFAQDKSADEILAEENADKETMTTNVFEYSREKIAECANTPVENIEKSAVIKIEYSPFYDEARIYYDCRYAAYERGAAMNAVMAVLQSFTIEQNYKHYSYLTADREKYYKTDRGVRMAEYMSYVKFTR